MAPPVNITLASACLSGVTIAAMIVLLKEAVAEGRDQARRRRHFSTQPQLARQHRVVLVEGSSGGGMRDVWYSWQIGRVEMGIIQPPAGRVYGWYRPAFAELVVDEPEDGLAELKALLGVPTARRDADGSRSGDSA